MQNPMPTILVVINHVVVDVATGGILHNGVIAIVTLIEEVIALIETGMGKIVMGFKTVMENAHRTERGIFEKMMPLLVPL